MKIEPKRPDLEIWRRNANLYSAPKILWLLDMLEEAAEIMEADIFDPRALVWIKKLRGYRGESDAD